MPVLVMQKRNFSPRRNDSCSCRPMRWRQLPEALPDAEIDGEAHGGQTADHRLRLHGRLEVGTQVGKGEVAQRQGPAGVPMTLHRQQQGGVDGAVDRHSLPPAPPGQRLRGRLIELHRQDATARRGGRHGTAEAARAPQIAHLLRHPARHEAGQRRVAGQAAEAGGKARIRRRRQLLDRPGVSQRAAATQRQELAKDGRRGGDVDDGMMEAEDDLAGLLAGLLIGLLIGRRGEQTAAHERRLRPGPSGG